VAPRRFTNLWDKTKIEGLKMLKPLEFVRQVKAEVNKITWPSRKETTSSTIAVFIMVVLASVFLYFADQVMALAVRLILGIGA
jgi:preprotein translocase subunit SecE